MTYLIGLLGRTKWVNTLKGLEQHNALKPGDREELLIVNPFILSDICARHMNLLLKQKQANTNIPKHMKMK